MSASPLHYRVASDAEVAASAENEPELRLRFEALGFVPLDSMVARHVEPDGFEQLAADYEPPAAALFRLHAGTPDTVLAAPDRSAYARLSWFWGSPCAHLLTLLDDGQLVETRMAWTVDPPWPMVIQRYYRFTSREREELYDALPGRPVRRPVATDDPAVLLPAHRQHVAEVAGAATPVDHDKTERLCVTLTSAYAATWRSHERIRKIANALSIACLVLAALVAWLAFRMLDSAALVWTVTAVVISSCWVISTRVQWLLRHARWLRVPFRGPASASAGGP